MALLSLLSGYSPSAIFHRVEEYIDWLVEKGELDEAAKRCAT